ncbi:MAG: GGDEF domain-containing protein [Treponema sp.]|nr:GGDEF domain-containing protein [Treponema sp.]
MRVIESPSPDAFLNLKEEIENLKHQNQRLLCIINALMYEYNTICEVNFKTGKVNFLELRSSPFFKKFEIKKEFPTFEELAAIYLQYGIYKEDISLIQPISTCEGLSKIEYGKSFTQKYRNDKGIYGELKIVRIDDESVLMGFSEKDKEIHELQDQMYTDSLTHVRNRKYYDEHLANQSCSALVIADIDSFKQINDTYGHLYGDNALTAISEVLQKSVRDSDNIVRYGGDEFLISLKDITPEILSKRLEKIRNLVEKIQIEKCPQLHLSMSFGAVYGEGLIKDMFSIADKLLYKSKKTKNTITISSLILEQNS